MNNCTCGNNIPTCDCIPKNYPYNRPVKDSYAFCCCGHTPDPKFADYPSCGPVVGSMFVLDNAYPYLYDSTFMQYGQVLDYSENVYTKITKRCDPSCINLAARFDMTDTSLNNTVRYDFLKNYTARKYEELEGVLPIIKPTIKLKVHYKINDADGGITYEGSCVSEVKESYFHFTSIKDTYVQSLKGLIITDIPAMTYGGTYTITITRIEAFLSVIDTKSHLQDALNPYYSFTDNNRKIVLQSDIIERQTPDSTLLIGECDVCQSFEYLANVTTRLRMSFIVFTSIPIACGDTSSMWFALNEPTEQSITQLRQEVTAIEDEIALIKSRLNAHDVRFDNLESQVELNTNNLNLLKTRVDNLEVRQNNTDRVIESILSRLDALENVPLALVAYKEGKELKRSQITWKTYGELYQVAETFTASGDFMYDVGLGKLIPVIKDASEYDGILERVSDIEVAAAEASTNAENAVTVTESLSTIVESHSTTLGDHEVRISTLENTNSGD